MNCGRCNKHLKWYMTKNTKVKLLCRICTNFYIDRWIEIRKQLQLDTEF